MAKKKENKYRSSGVSASTETVTGNKSFGLGRGFNVNDPVVRNMAVAALCSGVILCIIKTVQGTMPSDEITTYGIMGALNFVFSYLLAVELDPEPGRRYGGLVAGVLTVVLQAVCGAGDAALTLLMVFLMRLFNRSSGQAHQVTDNVLMLILSYWLAHEGFWFIPLVTGFCYALESQIPEGSNRSLYVAAIAFAMMFIMDHPPIDHVLNIEYLILGGIMVIFFLPELSMARFNTARGDRTGMYLNARRVQIGQSVFLIINFFLAWYGGNKMVVALLPLWGAGLGVGLFLLYWLIQNKERLHARAEVKAAAGPVKSPHAMRKPPKGKKLAHAADAEAIQDAEIVKDVEPAQDAEIVADTPDDKAQQA